MGASWESRQTSIPLVAEECLETCKIKYDIMVRNNARVVAQCYTQAECLDFGKTYPWLQGWNQ